MTRCREVNISTTRLLLSEATGGRRQKSEIPTTQEQYCQMSILCQTKLFFKDIRETKTFADQQILSV